MRFHNPVLTLKACMKFCTSQEVMESMPQRDIVLLILYSQPFHCSFFGKIPYTVIIICEVNKLEI